MGCSVRKLRPLLEECFGLVNASIFPVKETNGPDRMRTVSPNLKVFWRFLAFWPSLEFVVHPRKSPSCYVAIP